jgi:hypothetical protein
MTKEEDLDLQSFINKQGLQGTGQYLKGLSNVDLLEENIFVIFEVQFDKNGWKYKVQTITKFQGIIKSLYTCVFKKAHVFNETLSLEFAHVIVMENKGIEVNWVGYAYSTYRREHQHAF